MRGENRAWIRSNSRQRCQRTGAVRTTGAALTQTGVMLCAAGIDLILLTIGRLHRLMVRVFTACRHTVFHRHSGCGHRYPALRGGQHRRQCQAERQQQAQEARK